VEEPVEAAAVDDVLSAYRAVSVGFAEERQSDCDAWVRCLGGLTVYSGEWWHFDAPGAYVERPILDVPVN
jgi:D-alanyl-D-alanine dipeptidase